MAGADPAVKLLGSLVGAGVPGASMFSLLSSGLNMLTGGSRKSMNIQDDETFEDNCKFIRSFCGDDVAITTDMPPIHEEIGLEIADMEELKEIDAAMKAGMVAAINAVKKIQAGDPNNYISWRRLQQIFDGDLGGLFSPVVEEDKYKADHTFDEAWSFLVRPGESKERSIGKADQLIKDVVADGKILDALKINRETIAEVFSARGLESFGDFFYKNKKAGHIAIDVGVVRFPRLEDPFFKLYRLRVLVFSSQGAFLGVQHATSGMFGEFRERKYRMTKAFTAKFDDKTAATVNKQFEDVMALFTGGS